MNLTHKYNVNHIGSRGLILLLGGNIIWARLEGKASAITSNEDFKVDLIASFGMRETQVVLRWPRKSGACTYTDGRVMDRYDIHLAE